MSSTDYVERKKELIKKSFSVCVSKVVKLLEKDSCIKICLYEGPDDKLYYSRFYSNSVRDNHSYVDCNGKDNVIKTISALQDDKAIIDFKRGQLVAFVDRDFDDIPQKSIDNVYKTPWYSIENFCCSKKAFEKFLKMELGLQKVNDDDRKKVNRLSRQYYAKFLDDLKKTAVLNSWGLYQRLNGLGYSKCHFNGVNVDDACSQRDCWSYLENKFSALPRISAKKRRDLLKDPIHKRPVERYRGKWIFHLYSKIIRDLIFDTNNGNNETLINTKPRSNDVTFSSLVKYADCPKTLESFLKKYNWL